MLGSSFDRHHLGLSAGCKRDVDSGRLIHREDEGGNLFGGKTLCRRLQGIAPRSDVCEDIVAAVVAVTDSLDSSIDVGQQQAGLGDHGSGGVPNHSIESGTRKLRESCSSRQGEKTGKQYQATKAQHGASGTSHGQFPHGATQAKRARITWPALKTRDCSPNVLELVKHKIGYLNATVNVNVGWLSAQISDSGSENGDSR